MSKFALTQFVGAVLSASAMWGHVAAASPVTVPVLAADDVVHHRSWYYGGNDRWSEASANPNTVYHSYEPGNGNSANTSLTFRLGGVSVLPADISSVTLNFDVLTIWSESRDDVGEISGVGSVLASRGTGWKSYDVTSQVVDALTRGTGQADFFISYTGYSGFNFGAAEGGNPAYLSITAVPEPDALLMALAALGVVGVASRRRRQA